MKRDRERTVSSQPRSERRVSRRQYLRTLGTTTAIGSGTIAAVSEPVAAADVSEFADAKPNHVTITTEDTAFLNRYRPLLDLRNVPPENHPELYGWKASSPENDTLVGVYACEYAVQRDFISLTSHSGDHEWIYVFVDRETGEVREVSYAAYHWLRGYILNPAVDGTDGGDHPMFLVADTYHNYIPMAEPSENGVLLDVNALGDVDSSSGPLYQWLANGLKDAMEPGAVHNPWLLDSDGPLDAWWSRSGSGRLNRWIVNGWAFAAFTVGIGIRGGEQADLGDASL
jgi:hypothetical protein